MYLLKSLKKRYLQIQVSPDGRKVTSSQLTETEPTILTVPILRTGIFDNQNSSASWNWAWTTDTGPFEVWRPRGIYLRLEPTGEIKLFKNRDHSLPPPSALSIGKTGPVSYGIIGSNLDGSKISLVKDTYPFFDALMNVTYDGICEIEDFYPLCMIGRELGSRLKIPFDETINM